jgi:cobalt-zinc-cadmium efflux system protein
VSAGHDHGAGAHDAGAGHDHSHGAGGHNHAAGANAKMLSWALALTFTYFIAEVIGGFVFNSLALLSDAAHMMTDVMALVIALLAIKLGRSRPTTSGRSGIVVSKSSLRPSMPCCCSA